MCCNFVELHHWTYLFCIVFDLCQISYHLICAYFYFLKVVTLHLGKLKMHQSILECAYSQEVMSVWTRKLQ